MREPFEKIVLRGCEPAAHRSHPARQGQKRHEITRFGRGRRIRLEPRNSFVDAGQGKRLVLIDELMDGSTEASRTEPTVIIAQRRRKSLDKRAAYVRSGVGRDQIQYFVELELCSNRVFHCP